MGELLTAQVAGAKVSRMGSGAALTRDAAVLMSEIGLQVGEQARADYKAKSEGGTDSAGIQWKPNSPATIARKAYKKPAVKRLVEQRRQVARQLRRVRSSRRGALLRQRHKALSDEIKALISRFTSESRIGVDTGAQEMSGLPGFQATDGRGGGVFIVDTWSVEFGYARTYSEHFDLKRELLPDQLSAKQEQEAVEKVASWVAERIGKVI